MIPYLSHGILTEADARAAAAEHDPRPVSELVGDERRRRRARFRERNRVAAADPDPVHVARAGDVRAELPEPFVPGVTDFPRVQVDLPAVRPDDAADRFSHSDVAARARAGEQRRDVLRAEQRGRSWARRDRSRRRPRAGARVPPPAPARRPLDRLSSGAKRAPRSPLGPVLGCASGLAGGLLLELSLPPCHRRLEAASHLLESAKLGPEHAEQPGGCRRRHGRVAPAGAEDRHLAEEVPRAEGRDLRPVRADGRRSVCEDEEGVPGRAFAGQADSFVGRLGLEPAAELLQLALQFAMTTSSTSGTGKASSSAQQSAGQFKGSLLRK